MSDWSFTGPINRNNLNRNQPQWGGNQSALDQLLPSFVKNLYRYKTFHCQHESSTCVKNAIQGLLQSLIQGIKLRAIFAIIMLLLRKNTVSAILSDPINFMRFPVFLALQSFTYKLALCALRILRRKGDQDGRNPFIAGALSGLSILLIKDESFRALLALYMFVRSARIWVDTKEAQGSITSQQINIGLLVLGIAMSMTFSGLYMMDWNIWANSKWQALHWIFGFNNQPNDRIFRDILRQRLKV
ncbi:hypothetical protein FGO68_gene4158 [Halteria grandinella]|uniref:Transmembrane protein n=1 Tax=Halteria grandinella TaxID=5974 RepID=A0A8J8NIR1_HALGN|nr:hypothetical protein FGO68_gene4158 [Halteria grandinella]